MRKTLLGALAVAALAAPATADAQAPAANTPRGAEPIAPFTYQSPVYGMLVCSKSYSGRSKCYRPPAGATLAWWDVAKCAVAIGAFIAGNALAIAKIKKLGGVWAFAKRLHKAKGRERKLEILVGFFGYLTGTTAVVEACGG